MRVIFFFYKYVYNRFDKHNPHIVSDKLFKIIYIIKFYFIRIFVL